jgi:hypothetical protein
MTCGDDSKEKHERCRLYCSTHGHDLNRKPPEYNAVKLSVLETKKKYYSFKRLDSPISPPVRYQQQQQQQQEMLGEVLHT